MLDTVEGWLEVRVVALPTGELLVEGMLCDEPGVVWFFEMPTLRLVGCFAAETLTVNGLDVCEQWLMLQPAWCDENALQKARP